jgi:outer membrane protein TolC
VEQAIPYPGKLSLQGDIADLSADVATYEAATYAQDLVLAATQLYTELYRIQEQIDLIASFQIQLRDFEEAAATQYEVGTGMQQSILKAQLERHRLTIQQEKLAETRTTTLEQLARLLNRRLDDLEATRLAPPTFETTLDTTLATVLARRPEAQALDAALERAERQIDLARKQFLPDFMVNATYFDIAENDVPMSADGRDAVALGVGVKIPLWRDALRAGVEEAELRRRQVEARRDALETSIQTQLADLTGRLDRQREQLALLRETLIPQAEATLEATLSAYTTGRTGFIDLLDAERTLFTLRMETTDTFARLLKTSAALERTLGLAE